MKQGNYKQAVALYTEALEACPPTDKDVLKALYSNRSLAHGKCMKYNDALDDAEKAIQYGPTWAKGYWRKGVALVGLGRMYDATEAFYKSWACDRGNKETEKKLRQVILALPDEQLGMKILDFLSELELDVTLKKQEARSGDTQDGRVQLIEPAKYEMAERVELEEGAFGMIRNQGKKIKIPKQSAFMICTWIGCDVEFLRYMKHISSVQRSIITQDVTFRLKKMLNLHY